MMSDDKRPLQSKKFIALLLGIGWLAILSIIILWIYRKEIDHYAFILLMTSNITIGFLLIGYVLGQAALDKYALTVNSAIDQTKVDKTEPK